MTRIHALVARIHVRMSRDPKVKYYQRLTQHILRTMPTCADRTLWLDPFRRTIRQTQASPQVLWRSSGMWNTIRHVNVSCLA